MLFCDGGFAFEFVVRDRWCRSWRCSVDGIGDIVGLFDEDQLRAGEPDGAVESAAAADHDDFVFQSGGIGQLPDFLADRCPPCRLAVAAAMAPAAPEVMIPDSAPVSSANLRPTA